MKIFHYERVSLDDKRMTDIYRLRYKVYCLECGFEDPCDYQNHTEMDEYDASSVHFLVSDKSTEKIIGTVRIILADGQGFPVFRYFDVDAGILPLSATDRAGEISRLAISKEYRRRATDRVIYNGNNVVHLHTERDRRNWRLRYENELVTGLYYRIYAESIELGLTHLYAIMSDGLYSLLSRWGLIWHPVGQAQEHHGIRRPYIASIEENMHWFNGEKTSFIQN